MYASRFYCGLQLIGLSQLSLLRCCTSFTISTVPTLKSNIITLAMAEISTGTSSIASTSTKQVLFDVPVSNNGARCRIVLYKKGITDDNEIQIISPATLGGLKSTEYLAVNPQGKMPAYKCNEIGLALAESDTITRYLLHKYNTTGPSFQPDLPLSNYICRIHDLYLGPIQSCMYKMPPFGQYGTRADALAEFVKQMNVIEDLVSENTRYICNDEVSHADAALFPTMIFAHHMLPKYGISPALPPKIQKWFTWLIENDEVFQKIYSEIMDALKQWDERGRFDPLLGAGWRDIEPQTLFDKIISGDIPAAIVKETDKVLAFKDINPVGPAHVLVIPKNRMALTRISKANSEHTEILGQLMVVAAEILRDSTLGFTDGGRIVINDGPDGGQEVMHLHLHVIGGRSLTWPPG